MKFDNCVFSKRILPRWRIVEYKRHFLKRTVKPAQFTNGSEHSDGEKKRSREVPLILRAADLAHLAAVRSVVFERLNVVTELLDLRFERGQRQFLVVVVVEARSDAPQFTDRRVLHRDVSVHRLKTTGQDTNVTVSDRTFCE